MEKTKLGLSVGLLGAIVWFACYFGGYVATFLVVGYVLLCEKDEWLKKLSVKAVLLMVAFSVVSSVLYILPNLVNCFNSFLGIFGGSFYLGFISNIINFLTTVLDLIEKIVFIVLGALAFLHVTIPVPVLDGLVDKHFGQKEVATEEKTEE